MTKKLVLIFVCMFIGVALFSFFKSIDLSREKIWLSEQIDKVLKPKLKKLEKVTTDLKEENVKISTALDENKKSMEVLEDSNLALSEKLRTTREQLRQTTENLQEAQDTLQAKEETLAKVNKRYNDLVTENDLLKEKFNAMFLEFVEMRKIISANPYLKSKLRARRAGYTGEDLALDAPDSQGGNRGFLVRNGESTHTPKARIRVLHVEE